MSHLCISGRVIAGVLTIKYQGTSYQLIKSNATAVEAYLHTNDKTYLLALATTDELKRYEKEGK